MAKHRTFDMLVRLASLLGMVVKNEFNIDWRDNDAGEIQEFGNLEITRSCMAIIEVADRGIAQFLEF